jgi:hypothetical protein
MIACMRTAGLILLAAASLLVAARKGKTELREIPLAELRDKIRGGWAGQMIGVSYGAPTEFKYREKINEDPLPPWDDQRVRNSLNQDDLYVDMTLAEVLDKKGLDATAEDFGAVFKDAQYRLWHANLAARRALRRGVPASLSGTPRYNVHANDIDFQIEADFIGLMAPGMPASSNAICARAGSVMNYGDGIYGGMFVSAMYSAAFFESDPRKLVEAGLKAIPARSPYGKTIADVLAWSKQHPDDWKKVWALIEQKWNSREPCPEGALRPFNIDAKLNGAYVVLGMLYGRGDFFQTMDISTRAGQDSDCNPASACGVLGVVMGYRGIPDEWKRGIPAIAQEKFRYTNYTLDSIVESTYKRAILLAERNQGRVDGDKLLVPLEEPVAPKLEIWDDYGSPRERIPQSDPRWRYTGSWTTEGANRVSSVAGAEAAINFYGTGFIIVGPYLPDGGKADIYLDGKLQTTVDVYPDEDQAKSGESVFHAFRLKDANHQVRLVVRGERYPGSAGARIAITDLVVFR